MKLVGCSDVSIRWGGKGDTSGNALDGRLEAKKRNSFLSLEQVPQWVLMTLTWAVTCSLKSFEDVSGGGTLRRHQGFGKAALLIRVAYGTFN